MGSSYTCKVYCDFQSCCFKANMVCVSQAFIGKVSEASCGAQARISNTSTWEAELNQKDLKVEAGTDHVAGRGVSQLGSS